MFTKNRLCGNFNTMTFLYTVFAKTSCLIILNSLIIGNMRADALQLKNGPAINGNQRTAQSTTGDDTGTNPPWLKLPNNTGDFCPRKDVCIWKGNDTHDTMMNRCCTDCVKNVASDTGTNPPWLKLPNNTGDFCPRKDVCIWKGNDTHDTVMNRCCIACSCEETCTKDGNCCFPITSSSIVRNMQSCISIRYPKQYTSADDKSSVHAYYMVESNPEDGCKDIEAIALLGDKQCGDVSAAEWGSFYPVQSPHIGQIYKNSHCAKCHGVKDPVFSVPQLKCLSPEVFFDLTPNVLNMLDVYGCSLTFKFHLPNYRDRCDVEYVDYCDPLVYPKGVALTLQEINTACTSGLVSPYTLYTPGKDRDLYANIFCAMCNSMHFDISRTCPPSDNVVKDTGYSFSMVLKGTTDQYFKTTSEERQACFMETGQLCRIVHCAHGMVLKAGVCERLDTEMDGFSFVVMVKLVPERAIDSDTQVLQSLVLLEEGRNVVFKTRPWSEKWKIKKMYTKLSDSISSVNRIQDMIVQLEYNTTLVNPAIFFKEVARILESQTWTFSINFATYSLHQSFAEFTELEKIKLGKDVFSGLPVHTIPGLSELSNDTNTTNTVLQDVSYSELLLKITETDALITYITETLFCDQIELDINEYVLYSNYNVLYYKRLDRYLYNGQFSRSVNVNGIAVIKICLDNAGFVVPSSLSNHLCVNFMAVLQLVLLANLSCYDCF